MNKKKNTLLIVDADKKLQKMMNFILDEDNFKVIECLHIKQAVQLTISTKPDLILIDLESHPTLRPNTIEAFREWGETPIIIISSNANDNDIADYLNAGANDYVVKPFNANVLLARIKVALRSTIIQTTGGTTELKNGPLRIDLIRHEVFLNGQLIAFTPKEYNLLEYFMSNCGKMLTHRDILKTVWGDAHSEDTQYLRVFIGHIREKIESNPHLPVQIITDPGVGYRMENLESNF